MFYFISNNLGKYREVKSFIPNIQLLNIDLPEIQSLNAEKIIEAKLTAAMLHHQGEFLIEDTSLNLTCLGGLPGPFIKWFLKSLGVDGLFNLVKDMPDTSAEAHTYLGYVDSSSKAQYYHGVLKGHVVSPRGEQGFGWDSLFQPEGSDLTLAEMSLEQKREISSRGKALRNFLMNREETQV